MLHKIVNKVAYGKNRRYSKMNEINKTPEQILKKFEIWSKSQDQTEREKKKKNSDCWSMYYPRPLTVTV